MDLKGATIVLIHHLFSLHVSIYRIDIIKLFADKFIRVQKKTKPIMWVGLISSLIDVVLNYVLVPQIGIKGAAISTIVSLAFISLSYLFMVYPMILKALSITSTTKILEIN